MNLRTLIALLLMLTLTLTALGSPRKEAEEAAAARDEKITPDEEREARELAALFVERWQETEDINPLIGEFFVQDFTDRLHYQPQILYFGELKNEQLLLENPDDLRRHYVAMTNFLYLLFRLEEIYAPLLKSEEGQAEMDVRQMLPASVLNVFRSNPIMNALMSEEDGNQAEGQTEGSTQRADSEADARLIKNIEELRSLTSTLEQANALLRAHLKTLPHTLSINETMANRQDDTQSSDNENDDPLNPRIYLLSEDFYGYPKGTRLICLNVMLFHVDLVRVEGRLKVLSVYLQTD